MWHLCWQVIKQIQMCELKCLQQCYHIFDSSWRSGCAKTRECQRDTITLPQRNAPLKVIRSLRNIWVCFFFFFLKRLFLSFLSFSIVVQQGVPSIPSSCNHSAHFKCRKCWIFRPVLLWCIRPCCSTCTKPGNALTWCRPGLTKPITCIYFNALCFPVARLQS